MAPLGNVALINPCISVGLAKVKVCAVLSEMKTLLELMLVFPDWVRGGLEGMTGSALVPELGLVGVTGGGALDLQTDGCPLQVYPA